MRLDRLWCVGTALVPTIICLIAVGGCTSDFPHAEGPAPAAPPQLTQKVPLYLAQRDGVANDSEKIFRFQVHLGYMGYAYLDSPQEIAKQTVLCQARLNDRKVRESLLSIIDSLDGAFDTSVPKQRYTAYAEAYAGLRTRGKSVKDAKAQLRRGIPERHLPRRETPKVVLMPAR